MKVRDIMTSQVQSCAPDTNLATATELMWSNDCGVLPVIDDGKLAGIITDRDVCIALGTRNHAAGDILVRDVRTAAVETCKPNEDVHKAMESMRRSKVRRLPVVNEEGGLEGMLSLNDIVLRVERTQVGGLSYEQVLNTIKAVNEHRAHSTVPPTADQLTLVAAS